MRRMKGVAQNGVRRAAWIAWAIGLALVGPARGEEERPTYRVAAEAVLAAVRAGDQDLLVRLATRGDAEPWTVADELLAMGEADAADAFARATPPRKATERLPDYLASRRGK